MKIVRYNIVTLTQVRRRFDDAVIIGFMPKGSGAPLAINPAEEEILEQGTRVIALAHNGGCLLPVLPVQSQGTSLT